MPARFRYCTPDGREVELSGQEALERQVRDGRLTAETPLYDAETDQLGPAGEHDAFRRAVEEPAAAAPEPDRPTPAPSALPDLGVTLAPSEEVVETTDQIVRRLEEERASDLETSADRGATDPALVDPYNETLRSWGPPDGPDRSTPRDGSGGRQSGGSSRGRDVGGGRRAVGAPRSTPPGLRIPPTRTDLSAGLGGRGEPKAATAPPSGRGGRVRSGVAAALLLALVGGAGFLLTGAETGRSAESPDPDPGATAQAPGPLDPAGIADRLAASEGIAFAHMVDGMAVLARRHGVAHVPRAWLEGGYFASAADHPEVRAYWTRYTGFVEELRRRDEGLFRESFVNRLESLEVGSAVISLRLAQAMYRFGSSRARRDTVYTRMDDLARAALELHDLLVERSDELSYEPVVGPGISRDPFLQVHSDDPGLKEEVWALLERIFDDLEALHGETRWSRDRLNEGVLDGLRATGA